MSNWILTVTFLTNYNWTNYRTKLKQIQFHRQIKWFDVWFFFYYFTLNFLQHEYIRSDALVTLKIKKLSNFDNIFKHDHILWVHLTVRRKWNLTVICIALYHYLWWCKQSVILCLSLNFVLLFFFICKVLWVYEHVLV